MEVYIHGLGSSTPAGYFAQSDFKDVQLRALKDPKLRRVTESIYKDSGIDTRHSVVVEPGGKLASSFYGIAGEADEPILNPSSRERNNVFAEVAPPLSIDAARQALDQSGFSGADITHVIIVSCTGFSNPGIDLVLMRELGVTSGAERYMLGFMGCNAAFPAMRMAKQFCEANQKSVVLVVCVELCSLHLQLQDSLDSLLSNSLFSDGAAACVISARRLARQAQAAGASLKLDTFSSAVLPNGADDMAWRIGNHGFDIVLSSYVPRIIGANIQELADNLLRPSGLSVQDVSKWAVHPGGKSILDKIHRSLALDDLQLAASRNVLRKNGNMSSSTILFVLKEILESSSPSSGGRLCAISFGPGLTIEMALLSLIVREPVSAGDQA